MHYTDADRNHESFDQEISDAVKQLQTLYSAAREALRSSHIVSSLSLSTTMESNVTFSQRSTVILSPALDSGFVTPATSTTDISVVFDGKLQLITSFSKGFAATILELLVALSGVLTDNDQHRLGPLLWNECLESSDLQILPPVGV
jgi:hypothetical protein